MLLRNVQYRLRQAQYPASSWGEVDSELWLMYMTPTASHNTFTKKQHPLENAMTSILRGPVTSIRALIFIAVYDAAANIRCYTAPSHKVIPRL